MLADSNVYLIMSNIIATMDISKARDDNGEEITPSGKFTSGFVRYVFIIAMRQSLNYERMIGTRFLSNFASRLARRKRRNL